MCNDTIMIHNATHDTEVTITLLKYFENLNIINRFITNIKYYY